MGGHPGGSPGTSTGSLVAPLNSQEGRGWSWGGRHPSCPLPLALPFSLTCIFRSFLLPSPPSLTFLLFSFLPLFSHPPSSACRASLTRPYSVWLSQAAGVKHPTFRTLPPEKLVRSSWCSEDSGSQPGGTRLGSPGEGAAGSPRQSTPPAHWTCNSALAWRRAPRARPDLNVLFVRLALGRSSPSASVRLACTGATSPAPRAPATRSPRRERALPCSSRRTRKQHVCRDEHTARVRRAQGTRTILSLHPNAHVQHATCAWRTREAMDGQRTGGAIHAACTNAMGRAHARGHQMRDPCGAGTRGISDTHRFAGCTSVSPRQDRHV